MPKYDVAIIGGGPGGYVAAIRAAQLGLKTALVEKERIGGLCLNWGCIPSKALLFSAELIHLFRRSQEFGISHDNLRVDIAHAIDRSRQVADRMVGGVEFLLEKNGVTVVDGTGRLRSRTEIAIEPAGDLLEADHIIVATGGVARSLPNVEVDGSTVIGSRQALELREAPESIAIIGGGPIGAEFAYLYRAYGSQVTIIEMLDHLLPAEDEEISRQLERAFKRQGIKYLTGASVQSVRAERGKARVTVTVGDAEQEVVADKALVSVGMAANSGGLSLEELAVELEGGFVTVDSAMRTSVDGVYAIGDVTGKLMLAHVASAQGVTAVEGIAGLNPRELDYERMPRCTYCQPQVASLGISEAEARQRDHEVKVGRFPFRASGKAVAGGSTEGMAKLVVDAGSGEILGCHIIGPEATELIAEVSVASAVGATAAELGWAVHAHPTLSEVVKEAALAAEGGAIHFLSGRL
jgi:dihydrolipoamide dehydrogenase